MSVDAKPWWQTIPLPDLRERVPAMSLDELERLLGEIRGTMSHIHAQLSGATGDVTWRRAAQQAQQFIAARKAIIVSEITARHGQNRLGKGARKALLIAEARQHLEARDFGAVLAIVLDLMAGAHARDEGAADG